MESPSEYRGLPIEAANGKDLPIRNSQMSYAGITQSEICPKKDQAIILDSINGLTVKQYVIEIAKLTSPINIRFVSRISNNRICMYLASKEIADEMIYKHKYITLNNIKITIKPFIARAKRIILSNVLPSIPNSVIEDQLIKNKIKLESKITYIKSGYKETIFLHIQSFRRQVYIDPKDIPGMPSSITVEYEDIVNRIFLEPETTTCYLCKQEGHLARQCNDNSLNTQYKNIANEITLTDQSIINLDNNKSTDNDIYKSSKEGDIEINPSQESIDTPKLQSIGKIQTFKRPCPASLATQSTSSLSDERHLSGSESSIESLSEEKYEFNKSLGADNKKVHKPSKKKVKPDKPSSKYSIDLDLHLQAIKKRIDDPSNKFPLDYLNFKSFLDKAFSSEFVPQIAADYTDNIEEISTMLRTLYKDLESRNLKTRFTKIIKKIEQSIPSPLGPTY